MNQQMDQMANEFGGRLDRMERQHVKRVVRWVNTNMDEFVADNTDISDVDFKDVSVEHGECFGKQQNC